MSPFAASLPPFALEAFVFILGLLTGSFLNVLALRSLKEESLLWPPSHCPVCQHELSPFDNIPLVSYLFLQGKCRYCRTNISWQYPAVELITGIVFVWLARIYLIPSIYVEPSSAGQELWSRMAGAFLSQSAGILPLPASEQLWLFAGMLVFACTLITVCVTDFREKLIPHEITYPSMLLGIAFSTFIRHDLLGTMAGIGFSYILFDFLAFYGLKLYLASRGKEEDESAHDSECDGSEAVMMLPDKSVFSWLTWTKKKITVSDSEVDGSSHSLPAKSKEAADENDPVEVMGGGDAVLAAVISAYLGWKFLLVALLLGFAIGTFMGVLLLFWEIVKNGLFGRALKTTLTGALLTSFMVTGFVWAMCQATGLTMGEHPWDIPIKMGGFGALAGGLLGLIFTGTRVSKPFPFGPALALGAFAVIFYPGTWLATITNICPR